jgi:ABC-type transport system substrate-binding protein
MTLLPRLRATLAIALALAAAIVTTLGTAARAADAPPAGPGVKKVLRVAFSTAETSFDPARINDIYSSTVCAHIFEALYTYDHLARPVKVVPLLAAGMPEVSPDFKEWTVRIRPGIYFQDDPAFKGQKRELVAADVLYAFRRIVDPANKSPVAGTVLETGIVGLAELRKAALDTRKPFDYDTPIPGLTAIDRSTLRFTLAQPRPRFIDQLAISSKLGAQAREVVEFYGEKTGEHPVGTGPFRLKSWVRGSKIVLERNPGYRERLFDAQPAPGDAQGQAILALMKGRRLPIVDEVEVSVIEEAQPMWLSFLNRQIDALAGVSGSVPGDFVLQAAPGGKLAPNLARQGIQMFRTPRSDSAFLYFSMTDPIVGGMTPDKVALRRALSLAYDVGAEIRLARRGQAIRANSPVVPFTSGYDPAFKSEMSEYNPAKARALLDLYGYVDRDGDGWRDMPDGSPLKLVMSTEPDQTYRTYNDLWRRSMTAVGVRTEFETQQWPAHYKQAQAGTLQMWMLGASADVPDGQDMLGRLYGPQAGQGNFARFKLPAFDALYERMSPLPDGPERDALFREANRIAAAYMPYKYLVHRISTDLLHPWVSGYRRPVFWNEWWHMVDVDMAHRKQP